jgi:hypothetical protein
VFHVKRFYVPLGVAAALAVVFALTFAFGQACPQGYTPSAGVCVQNLTSGQITTALGYTPLRSLANVAIGPANSTISGTVNIRDATPTTGNTAVLIALGAAQTVNSQTLINGGALLTEAVNFIPNETGANNAIAGSLPNGVTATTGLCVTVSLAHSLQAGANTFAFNGGTALPILSHRSGAAIATAYVSGGLIGLCLPAGSSAWFDMSQ